MIRNIRQNSAEIISTTKKSKNILNIWNGLCRAPTASPLNYCGIIWTEKLQIFILRVFNNYGQFMSETWQSIDEAVILKLLQRMPRMCAAIIEAKGGYFDEKTNLNNISQMLIKYLIKYCLNNIFI